MRKIKGSSSYLKNKVMSNLAKAALSIGILLLILLGVVYLPFFPRIFSPYGIVGVIFVIGSIIAFYYYVHEYRLYNAGWEGEKQVAKLLDNNLSNDYYLINDLYLRGGGGDIDHVVLAPGGIFVLETKNWSGTIICQGDTWQRPGKRAFNASPSHQVKRNATRIRDIIENSPVNRMVTKIEGIVVLTNKNANVNLNNPSVPVLRLPQLVKYITQRGSSREYSAQELETYGREILSQKA